MDPIKSAASAKKVIAGVVGIVFAAPLALVLGVTQMSSMLVQHTVEKEAAKNIAVMKSEQAWLVGQALTTPRPIGVFNTSPFSQDFGSSAAIGPNASFVAFVGDQEASLLVRDASRAVGLGSSKWAISASPDASKVFSSAAVGDDLANRAIFRHEEGHARMFENLRPIGPMRSIPSDASRVLAHAVDTVYSTQSKGLPPAKTPDWRASWMASLRAEAYSDAYSCVSVARKSPSAMRECALNLHATRIIPPKHSPDSSALGRAGETHNVDMASFMAAQLNPNAVSRLDAKGLDDLSGGMANASLEWAIARQATNIGFFSKDGAAWWAEEAKAAGLSPSEADAAWRGLKESVQSTRPAAVFSEKSFQAGGIVFHAQGLPSELASSPDSSWRFDGRGGARFYRVFTDPKIVEPISASIDKEPIATQKIRRDASYRGAFSTHAALASIVGADLSREGARVSLIATNTRDKAAEFERFFSRISKAISPADSASPALSPVASAQAPANSASRPFSSVVPIQASPSPSDPDMRAKLAERRASVAASTPDYSSRRFFGLPKPAGA